MDALRSIATVALALSTCAPVIGQPPDPVARWRPLIAEASHRFGIPQSWIMRVMRAESHGLTELNRLPIRSPVGAMGLMQLMPGTWRTMRERLTLGDDPDDPRDNILAGSFFLRQLYDRFGYPGLFAAYNAGPERYAGFLQGKRTLSRETQIYLARVADVPLPLADGPETPRNRLFFTGGASSQAPSPPAASLFASLGEKR